MSVATGNTHHLLIYLITLFYASILSQETLAQYKIDSGDVVEISVFGVPDLKRRAIVNIDGDVSVPLLGSVRVAGLTLQLLREKLESALAEKNIVRTPNVIVDLVELRPFFINGDVAKPGQHPYQPNLTARRAIAIAGGYDLARLKTDNPLLVSAELRSQYEGLWSDYVRRQLRVSGLKAELENKASMDMSNIDTVPVPKRIIDELVGLESTFFAARRSDSAKEREFLQRSLVLAQKSSAQVAEGFDQEVEGSRLQAENLERTTALSSKGLAISTRVFEEQRAAALQRARQLETGSRLADAQQRTVEASRKLERFPDDRRMRLSRELQDEVVELEKVRIQIQGVGEKLLYVGAIKSLLSRGGRNAPEIAIYRQIEGKPTWVAADENSEVWPGDVVDVVFSQRQLMISN